MKQIIRVLLLIVLLTACNKKMLPPGIQTHKSEIKTDSLKPVVLPSDSSQMRALFECDSAGKVILRDYNDLKSKGVVTQVVYRDGELRYKVVTKHDTIFVRETDIRYIESSDTVKYIKIKEPLAWWQRALMWMGAIWIVVFIIFIIWMLRRIWITTLPRSR